MAVTMKEIAQRAGCSIATVSKVVNRRDEHISEPTRKRILDLVEEMDYRPNTLAKSLRMRHTNSIGFILPDITDPFFPDIAHGIEDAAKRRGFAVLFYDTNNDPALERDCVAFMRAKMVDGLIVIGFLLQDIPPEELDDSTPTVLLGMDAFNRRESMGWVYTDTQAAVAETVGLLLDQGCRKVGYLCTRPHSDLSRSKGYRQALEQHGIELDESLIIGGCANVEAGVQAAKVLIGRGVDAIFGGNDQAAIGALLAAQELGVAVPRDLKVAGIDDTMLARFVTPSLTTVHQPAYELGQAAANMLIDHILDGAALTTLRLPCHLVRRDSM